MNVRRDWRAKENQFAELLRRINRRVRAPLLSLYDNVVSPQTYLGTDQIIITTTSNLDVDLAQDADYINICGNGSNICGSSIEAYENSEGGQGSPPILTGRSSATRNSSSPTSRSPRTSWPPADW